VVVVWCGDDVLDVTHVDVRVWAIDMQNCVYFDVIVFDFFLPFLTTTEVFREYFYVINVLVPY
jgi:hypothetical protein